MEKKPGLFSLYRSPAAIIPLGLSLAALILVVSHYMTYGITHNPDEGAAAHTFQLLMAGQLPFLAYFIFHWLPIRPRPALAVLVPVLLLWLAAFGLVFYLT